MSEQYERDRALKEAERNAAEDEFFAARKHMDALCNRPLFQAGFDRGWDRRASQPAPAQGDDRLREGLHDCIGCIKAAEIEGLTEVLAETKDDRLKDLVERRLLWVRRYAESALSAQREQPHIDADQLSLDGACGVTRRRTVEEQPQCGNEPKYSREAFRFLAANGEYWYTTSRDHVELDWIGRMGLDRDSIEQIPAEEPTTPFGAVPGEHSMMLAARKQPPIVASSEMERTTQGVVVPREWIINLYPLLVRCEYEDEDDSAVVRHYAEQLRALLSAEGR